MFTSTTAFNFDELRKLKLQDNPFRYVAHGPTVLNPKILGELCDTFPTTDHVGFNKASKVALCCQWNAFIEEIHSTAYREAIEKVTGLNLSSYEVGIGIRHFSKLSHGAPHADVPRKKVTHLIYFNNEWPQESGRLRLLRSKNLDDVHDVITPLKGNGLIFVVSRNSFHGFEPYEGVRNAIQINFEHSGWLSKVFSRYD